MTSWQRRARLAVATFGLACVVVVYFAVGERQRREEPQPIQHLPPRAVMETRRAELDSTRGSRTDMVRFGSFITYEDGSTSFVDGVTIEAPNRNGRTFVVTARKGRGTKDNKVVELEQDVRLRESDGFELATDRGAYHHDEALVRIDGAVSFSKGRMKGSGLGVTYRQSADVLRIDQQAEVVVGEAGGTGSLSLSAGSATWDRLQHLLTLERNVRVVDGTQVTTAQRAVIRLTASDDVVTFVELIGQAQIEGGPGSLERMRARDIDLDYTDTGDSLERAVLKGDGAITLREESGQSGRQFGGERLEVAVAPDGSVSHVAGTGRTQVTLPAGAGSPARRIEAETFEVGNDDAGGHLSRARFSDQVVFREGNAGGAESRVVRSQKLTVEMSAEEITRAVFLGNTTFEERELAASAAEATYVPKGGGLRLRGKDARGTPRIADHRITVDAPSIDVALDTRRIDAAGGVKAALRPGGARGKAPGPATRLPGLLRQDEQASVTAESLSYAAASGSALFSGSARLWQGDTEVGAQSIDMQQETGDLVATGAARSTIVFETGASTGRAHEIRYIDSARLITYIAGKTGSGAAGDLAQLNGPQGDLHARRIEVRLAAERRMDQIDARGEVTALVDMRTVKGAALVYRAGDESYHVTGTRTAPVVVEEACKVMRGRELTYSRSTDTMSIDGQMRSRTHAKSRSACQ